MTAMSGTCETFITRVLEQNWREALLNLNALDMAEMLRALAALDRLDLTDLWAHRTDFTDILYTRMNYARDVVVNRTLPTTVPGDLQATGQVAAATAFLSNSTPLVFVRDLSSQIPATPTAPQARLTAVDITNTARLLACDEPSIRAVAEVEAGRLGGFAGNRPVVRYELHVFDGRTNGAYRNTHPHLSQPTLKAGSAFHTTSQDNEWSMMFGAMILRDANRTRRFSDVWQSTSWGMFQIMGSNFASSGAADVRAFVTSMFVSEGTQLSAFAGFVRQNHLDRALIDHDWAAFARGYNGASYDVNHYDQRLEAAFRRFGGQPRPTNPGAAPNQPNQPNMPNRPNMPNLPNQPRRGP